MSEDKPASAQESRRLSFATLREANLARLPKFKNRKGKLVHTQPDGWGWALSTWGNAVLGELGEAANIIKKIEREDMSLEEARPALAEELADTVVYLDILASRAGIRLDVAVRDKFNIVSRRVSADVFITEQDSVSEHDNGG